jgi:hypothetical protein
MQILSKISVLDPWRREQHRKQPSATNSPLADISQGFEGEDIFRFRVDTSGLIGSGGKDDPVIRSIYLLRRLLLPLIK